MTYRRYAISEAVGAAVIYASAVLLHFVYDLSGGSTLAVIFGAVNESIWEHLKIFSVGYCGWALLQLLWLRVPLRRYTVGKCCGLYLLMGGLIGTHQLCKAIAGKPLLWCDLLSSMLLVIAAQLCSYLITVRCKRAGTLFAPALMLILLYYLMFFSFTAFPPQTGLFRDPITGGFGLPTDAHAAACTWECKIYG